MQEAIGVAVSPSARDNVDNYVGQLFDQYFCSAIEFARTLAESSWWDKIYSQQGDASAN